MSNTTPQPGPDLMNRVRAGFLLQNTTLAEWCREQKINASAARQAVYGTWNGIKGQAMRAKVLKAAGLQPEAPVAKRGKAAA